ncbi:glutathione S-transferase [Aspergillus homomorphus CBS 101889]|uniref:Glutathione S-transferase n=1 Tax=Aspergillus homomorphus (strain CBS 101889) TaxID=1450537 RepID=A0A395HX45_ASPHC|nr:glutathione S-transferase [Aspergillus homomorphus CBS 101889]RAL11428.1 glutathione S-transferase [Aspergillus homomorphus CBS 101889]
MSGTDAYHTRVRGFGYSVYTDLVFLVQLKMNVDISELWATLAALWQAANDKKKANISGLSEPWAKLVALWQAANKKFCGDAEADYRRYLCQLFIDMKGRDELPYLDTIPPQDCLDDFKWSADVTEQARITEWLAFAASWVQYGVLTARAIFSFGGSYDALGTARAEHSLREAQLRGVKSLQILDWHLCDVEWLALGRPTSANIAFFVYVALAPMGDVSLQPFGNVRRWIERVKTLPRFVPILGLADPLYRRSR